MKKEIMAYITALTDVYTHTVNMPVKNCLDNLMNFIEDIPEGKDKAILDFNIALENESLKKRIIELEESCENMCDIEKNLHEKLKTHELNNTVWRNIYKELEEENKILKEKSFNDTKSYKKFEKVFKGIN